MDSPTYIKNALRTESVPTSIEMHPIGLALILKIAVLSASLVDQAKRKIYYGKDIDKKTLSATAALISEATEILAQAIYEDDDINIRIDNEVTEGFNLNVVAPRMLHAALGCFTESGELVESIYNQILGKPFDAVNFGEEIGDIEWYQAIGFDASGVTETSCREKNIAKLRARYPEKFDADQAINRDLDAERKTLE